MAITRYIQAACLAFMFVVGCADDPAMNPPPAPACPDGQTECAGRCVDLANDESSCGACDASCEPGFICNGAGECSLSCQAGLTECGGICTNTQTDNAHCGQCDVVCAAGEVCDGAGACALSCQAGLEICAGVCTDTNTSREHCGRCGVACQAAEICDGAGTCGLSCQPGLLNCDGTCIDPLTSNGHCGASSDCAGANSGSVCADGLKCDGAGSCALSCQSGLLECGGTCVDPLTSNAHCGASGGCVGADAGSVCADGFKCDGAGQCALSCQLGLLDCAGTCIDPSTSNAYCGATADCSGSNAGSSCTGGHSCQSGQCVLSCAPGMLACSGTCIDPLSDNAHCGATDDCIGPNAGASCSNGFKCNGAGQCALSCQAGLLDCNGVCIDPLASGLHCGATLDCQGANAGQACGAGLLCSNASCQPNCGSGSVECAGGCYHLQSSPLHCGACGSPCATGEACFGGNCVFIGCDWVASGLAPGLGLNEPVAHSLIDQSCDLWIASPYGTVLYRFGFNDPMGGDIHAYFPSGGLHGVALDGASGRMFVVGGNSNGAIVYEVSPIPVTPPANLGVTGLPVYPQGMRVAPPGWGSYGGQLVIVFLDGTIAVVDPDTALSTVLANTGTLLSGLVFDGNTLYVGDQTNETVITVTPSGTISTFVSIPCPTSGLDVDPGMRLFVGCAFDDPIFQVALPGGAVTQIGAIDEEVGWSPRFLQFDGVNSLLYADGFNFSFEILEL